ncbi:putative membrane protein [Ruminiclostridium sufflavum DSM 19573]|uniref:Putative membrane protein n=1 Tax=Ruminiclostridium sufflavum DSM 19573 TaxID=1121337 RepID=A0A318YC21_9FIRM|nr:YibE/F family protein [Ruminiclostridium sufflavum]PYG90172.1 putative membrane protein [Ruminiclostridium sufflavum DSM 19573]
MKSFFKGFLYFIFIFLAFLFIFFGNRYVHNSQHYKGVVYEREEELNQLIFAKVISIDKTAEDASDSSNTVIYFKARVFGDKESNDKLITGTQVIDNSVKNSIQVSPGDKVVLFPMDDEFLFQYYYRFDKISVLGGIFAAFIILLGGIKGVKTIISLALTCLSIFFVFIPSIGRGFNIYLSSCIICLYIIVTTFTIIYGYNKKSATAAFSCLIGAAFSVIITYITDKWMLLTGYINDDAYMLGTILGIDNLDVKAIMFSMITIGAMGAIMDVSMSIASALYEIKLNTAGSSPWALLKSGFSIGRDMMGTMTNTLILAYIGSSLIVVLIYANSDYSLMNLLNKEELIFEFLQSLIGSLSLLLTIPITAVVCSFFFTDKYYKECSLKKQPAVSRYLAKL